MLDDTLKAIREAEAEAARLVASAGEEGARVIEEAEAKAAEIKEQESGTAKAGAENDLRVAREQGERIKAEALDKVNAEIDELLKAAETKENAAIKAVIDALVS